MEEPETPGARAVRAETPPEPACAIWAETCAVRFGVTDRSDRLTLDSIFNFFQETAISHAENLGVGRDAMASSGQVWILSRMSVQVDRRPQYGETITVRTWPRGSEKLFALRDWDIRDAEDQAVVRARSGWLIIDLEKRRPVRPQAVMETLPPNEGLDALVCPVAALDGDKYLRETARRKARYSDVDYNGHVNNVRYIQWIEDALRPDLLEQADRMRIDINYMNETLPGQIVELYYTEIADAEFTHTFLFEGRNPASGKTTFRAELRLGE